jgi:hypothetical protein
VVVAAAVPDAVVAGVVAVLYAPLAEVVAEELLLLLLLLLVLLLAMAAAWNAAKLLLAVGLMAKTIPFAQWPVCLQKNQRGLVTLSIVILQDGNCVAPAATGWNPESMPCLGVVMSVHGSAKVDCVTVWFFERNWNWTVSPTLAVTLEGLYSRPVSPTRTVMLAAETTAAEARATARVEKRIFSIREEGQDGCLCKMKQRIYMKDRRRALLGDEITKTD